MNTSEIRKRVANQMAVGFTMAEAFANIKQANRSLGRKVSVVAESRAKAEEANGTTQYGNFGKQYGTQKWGNQHNF